MAMTNEEIDAEIARLTALKEQNNKRQITKSNKPADGVYNPADYISQITNKMNENGYTDMLGEKQTYGSGDRFSSNLDVAKNAGKRGNRTEDQFGNPLPDTAYEYITQMLNSERSKGTVSKHTLRMIENEAKARYNLPSKFDISGKGWVGNTDKSMARAMNSMPYNGKAQQPAQTPQTQQTENKQKGKQVAVNFNRGVDDVSLGNFVTPRSDGSIYGPSQEDINKPKGKQVANSNKGVAGASVGDFIIRSDGSTHVLTQEDINWAKKKTTRQTQQIDENTVRGTADQLKADIANGHLKSTYNENSIIGATQEELDIMRSQGLSDDLYNKGMQAIKNGNGLNDDDMQFMNKYNQYLQQLSGAQPRDTIGIRLVQESEPHKFVTDQANADRYRKLNQIQKDTKKVNKRNKQDQKMKQNIAAAKEKNAAYSDIGTYGE